MQFLYDNLLLVAVIVLSAVALFLPYFNKLRYGPEVKPARVTEILNKENGILIDVRDAAEFKRGHIAGAKNVPSDKIQTRLNEFDKTRPIVLVDRAGGAARTVARLMRGTGFEKVFVLELGMVGWLKEGLPVQKG